MPLNPKLEEALQCAGGNQGQGLLLVAVRLRKTPATLYNWKSAGGIDGLDDAIDLRDLAREEGGWRGCVEDLRRPANVEDGDGDSEALRPTIARAGSAAGGTMRNDVRGATALLRKRKVRAKRHEADDRPMLGCHIGPLVPTPDDLLADAA